MPPKTVVKMAKTFEQAVHDVTAFASFSARNASIDELEALIGQMQELKLKGANTRSTKDKFYRLQSKFNELETKLNEKNKSMHTAIFMLNTNMTNDSKYKEDQTAFRCWIGRAEDALSELVDNLEESGMNLVTTSLQAPPATSDSATILQQMAKQQADIQKQLGKQFSESPTLMADKLGKQFTESQALISQKICGFSERKC